MRSGKVPVGDCRLTANISAESHVKLKMYAARQRTTIGELIETWASSLTSESRDHDRIFAILDDLVAELSKTRGRK